MVDQILHTSAFGFGTFDFALAVARVTVGAFFFLSGYHKLFNKDRHSGLVQTLMRDHVPFPKFNQWWVPSWEFTGGLLLIVGLFTAFAAAVLAIVCLVACACEAREKVDSYKPIDIGDRIDDYLYLPEVLYLALLAVSIFAGPGHFSIDSLVWR
jgi:putative oxidoreductase